MRQRGNGGLARAFITTAAVLFTAMMFAPMVPAFTFSGDVHTTSQYVSSYSDVYWSNIVLTSGETLTFKFSVTSGSTIHVYLIDNDELSLALSGGSVTMHTQNEYTRSVDRTWSTSGTYAIVLESTGTSYCKVDITRTTSSSTSGIFDNEFVCLGVAILGIIILVVIVAVVASRKRGQAPMQPYAQQGRPPMGPTPQGYPQPAPQYQGYQGPPRPPAGYPQPAPSYPQPAPSYPQPAPSYPQQQYPQQGYGAPQQAAVMVACKYCGLQIPSNTTICTRCGGRL
jgi:hypothetical protein